MILLRFLSLQTTYSRDTRSMCVMAFRRSRNSPIAQMGVSTICRSKCPGNGSVAIRKDGRVCAVGGWDGKYVLQPYIYHIQPNHLLLPSIRLYGTKIFKTLGTLSYHKQGCYALAFSNQLAERNLTDDDEGLSAEEKAGRRLWLASGGKDSRVCIWPLSSFFK
jgi:hypothetical protein